MLLTKFEPIDAQTLLSTPLPPVRWLIPDLLPVLLFKKNEKSFQKE